MSTGNAYELKTAYLKCLLISKCLPILTKLSPIDSKTQISSMEQKWDQKAHRNTDMRQNSSNKQLWISK